MITACLCVRGAEAGLCGSSHYLGLDGLFCNRDAIPLIKLQYEPGMDGKSNTWVKGCSACDEINFKVAAHSCKS